MNNRENAMKLRIHKLEQQTAIQKLTFDRLLSDLEMTESMGCAFAWDLVNVMADEGGWDDERLLLKTVIERVTEMFQSALIEGNNFQEARKWLREQVRKDATFRRTAVEAAGKNPDLELETPFGRYSIRLLSAT